MVLGVLTLVTAVVLAINVAIAKHRNQGFAYQPGSFASAYLPAELPTVRAFKRLPDGTLAVDLGDSTSSEWTVRSQAPATSRRVGSSLLVQSPPGIYRHELVRTGTPAVSLDFLTTSSGPQDMTFGGSLLATGSTRHSLDALTANLDDYPLADVERARLILAPLRLENASDTETKLMRVWQFLHEQLRDAAQRPGAPPPDLIFQPALTQYEEAVAGRASIYCAHLAHILTFFATVAGIRTRLVDAVGQVGDVILGAHAFVEAYLPEEARFVYTDLATSIAIVRAGANGPPLNTVEVAQLLQARASSVLVAMVPRDGSLVGVPFDTLQPSPTRYVHPSATFVFRRDYTDRHKPWSVLWRYLVAPEPAVSLTTSSLPHYLKVASALAAFASVAAWFAVAMRLLLRRPGRAAKAKSPAMALKPSALTV